MSVGREYRAGKESAAAGLRAAEYLRMSTEHQQYSTENQADIIRGYAVARSIEIVRTYADEGRSGLRLDGRNALQALISDVETGRADFQVILVYDVSRWGRFQDADESAYYEYVCKRAGIAVHYCAEMFENDGSPVSTIVKGVKRAMAGEYSRELSSKVFIGQCRLIELGFRQGGPPGLGLRRWLGIKDVPGQYLDPDVRGIRVRSKNIQIDGEAVVRQIFESRSPSNRRYQDWFVGEIFVDPTHLTPNARRDGFEDTSTWREIRKEISDTLCKTAGTSAQDVSNKDQLSLPSLKVKTEKLRTELAGLRDKGFGNRDKTVQLSSNATKLHDEVTQAFRNAEAVTQAELQQLAAQVLDIKTEALEHVGAEVEKLDKEAHDMEVRDKLLTELMALFESQLQLPCLTAVREIVRDEYDYPAS